MITVGFSSRIPNTVFSDYIKKTCLYKGVEVIAKVNDGTKSLSQVYNEIINESSNDIIVLCHDDLEFETKNWGNKIIDHFRRNPDYGILGLAGSKFLHENARWWTIPQTMYGIVNHKKDGKKWTSTYSKDKRNEIEDVVLVDGLFIAIHKKRIKHIFDETIDGFHFYDLGFCVPNFIDDVNLGVIFDVRVTHLSIGQTNEQWEKNRQIFSQKYKESLPIEIKEEGLNETFIFIHNQELVLNFEKNGKFNNLEKYTYVFVGNKPVDKLSSLENLIVCRNLPINLENYPNLTAFTGWYALWKNNLIKTKYINLFEYDVNFHENLQQFLDRFYMENLEMVGYVPFPMTNFHFINNQKWVENIIPSIQKRYNIDIYKLYSTIIKNNPQSIWSTTSNTTFRFDTFEQYMKWFEPILEDIKETETAGHAQERSITFFSTIKRKPIFIIPNILKHLQLDSHKTQGHFVDLESNYNKLLSNTL